MYKICVFGGTTEGRRLVEFLSAQPVAVTVCVATEYGEELLLPAENTVVSARRLPKAEIQSMLASGAYDLVVDATHPYAVHITDSLFAACQATHTEYLRLLREETALPQDALFAADAAQAADLLDAVEGNILLTTGSKDLAEYSRIHGFAQRVFVRVLPMPQSLAACQAAGVKPANILAMQGPFSAEMNKAMLRQCKVRYLVTKNGGAVGGFPQKVEAARQTGATLVVIGRPEQKQGMSYPQVIRSLCKRFGLMAKPQVTVVGIGPGSPGMLTQAGSAAIQAADCLIGADRMLEAAAHAGQAVCPAVSPEKIAAFIAEHPEYQRVAVVLSGDVGFFSGAKKLLPLLQGYPVQVLPGISSLVYLCARQGISYEDVVTVSLHGRKHNIAADVRRHRRVFALVGGENSVDALCAQLTEAGLGSAKLTIGERLSYPDEKITQGTAQELCGGVYAPLSVVLIENSTASVVVTHGMPDEAFFRSAEGETVVPMTKSEVRSVSLSKLQLTRDAVCWDIGAGTGSVSIEMALQAEAGWVYAVEQKSAAAELLQKNAERWGAANLSICIGTAPDACGPLPAPTHVFIGGSGGHLREILSAVLEKNPYARIVATAVTLESIAECTACMETYGFDLQETVLLSAARSRQAGAYHLMAGQNPVCIFTMQRIERCTG